MFAIVSLAVALSVASAAPADLRAVVPPSAGEPALTVDVDLARGVVHAGDAVVPIGLDVAARPPAADVVIEPLSLGGGKHVVHVRVPARGADPGGPAWEALFAPGQTRPVFAGMTGWVAGDPGERSGRALQFIDDGDVRYVLLGDVREDLGVCGEPRTLLEPNALYPDSLQFRPATVQRLGAERRAAAPPLVAVPKGKALPPALAPLLVARGSSVSGSRGDELTDGDAKTRWTERRPGIGQGEFVVFAAPRGVPIHRLGIVLSRPDVAHEPLGAAPKTFYVATAAQAYRVTVPDDAWSRPGQPYEVAFPTPLDASCVSVVLDDAYGRGLAHPDVGFAEVVAYSEFDEDGESLVEVAKRLSSERGAAAAQLLVRAGPAAIDAVAAAYDGLDPRGRALAMDVAASQEPCARGAALLARGACDPAVEVARKAREKVARCPSAAPALGDRLRADASSRACLAPMLAALAPRESLAPLADGIASTLASEAQLAAGSGRGRDAAPERLHETRAVLRGALGDALATVAVGDVAALLADRARSPEVRLELMRAAVARLGEARAAAAALVEELTAGTPSFRTRYLLVEPLAALARAGETPAGERLRSWAASDPEWPVRAEAVRVLAAAGDAHTALERTGDPAPRVREAAFVASAEAGPAGAAKAAARAVGAEPWPFVREAAVRVLGRAPAGAPYDDALVAALGDRSARVRTAAIVSLAARRGSRSRDSIRARLDDAAEDASVRAAAAEALGALCDEGSVDRLTALARGLVAQEADPDVEGIAYAALGGLAALRPPDLARRLAPLLSPSAPPPVQVAARRALARPSLCR